MLLSGSGYFIPMNSKYYSLFYLQMSSLWRGIFKLIDLPNIINGETDRWVAFMT
jgi:hypothetical protein